MNQFEEVIKQLSKEKPFRLKSFEGKSAIFKIKGTLIASSISNGTLVLSGKTPQPEMYGKMKSRLHIELNEDGVLKINSYEHIASESNEKVAIRSVLEARRDLAISLIKDRISTYEEM